MDGEKKIASVWKPKRSDPFSPELLPVMTKPELLSGPQPDDFVDLERYVPTYSSVVLKNMVLHCQSSSKNSIQTLLSDASLGLFNFGGRAPKICLFTGQGCQSSNVVQLPFYTIHVCVREGL